MNKKAVQALEQSKLLSKKNRLSKRETFAIGLLKVLILDNSPEEAVKKAIKTADMLIRKLG